MNTQFPSWRDPRGTWEEREQARKDINAFWNAMRRQDPEFYRHYAQVRASFDGKGEFRNLPYTQWLALHQKRWAQILANDRTREIVKLHLGEQVPDFNWPINQEKPVKTRKVKEPKKNYNTVAVRFVRGVNLAKVYTYRVPKKVKLHLGEEVIVPSLFDGFTSNSIAVVVELHSAPQDTGPYDYKFITGRIQRIAAN